MRAFVALELPEAFVGEMVGVARTLARAIEGRFVPRGNYHLTLAFLGDIDEAACERAMSALDEACAGARPVRVASAGLGKFGRASDATLWLGIAEGSELMALAAAVREKLAAHEVAFDAKPFKPHITLARRARISKGQLPPIAFPSPARALRVTLFKSTLSQQGARYQALYSVEL